MAMIPPETIISMEMEAAVRMEDHKRALAEKDAEIARLRAALEIIAGSSDRLQALQAIGALDNIGPDV